MGEIKKYAQEYSDEVSHFMEKQFPNRSGGIVKRSRTADYYRWKYGPNPFGDAIMYTYWENGKLFGWFGAIPEPLVIRGEKVPAYQLTDAFVAPEMHGKGIFTLLANKVFEDIDNVSDLCFAIGPSSLSLPILTKKYDMYIGQTYRQVFSPIRFNEILAAKELKILYPLGIILNILRNNFIAIPDVDIEEIPSISKYLTVAPDKNSDFSKNRNSDYLAHRYERCPETYRYFRVSHDNGSEVALVIKEVFWNNIKLCYLIDVIGEIDAGNHALYLCRAMYGIGLKTSSALVSMELNHPKKQLSKMVIRGFLCHKREECMLVRQKRWPFLNPQSEAYSLKKWKFYSGDSDYI